MNKNYKVKITKDGPYVIYGGLSMFKEIIITDGRGTPTKWGKGENYPPQETYVLCRCGESKNKPFCDGTHTNIGFDGTETASKKNYLEQAEITKGPELNLTDAVTLCASARFCHRAGGIWRLTEKSDKVKLKEIAIQEACDCPAGRLVIWDKKTGKPTEPNFLLSVSIIEDPQVKVSGPIWVKGGVLIESVDGTQYEIRNRVTLCRCGKSKNKPFCDGHHISFNFNDGDESLKKDKK